MSKFTIGDTVFVVSNTDDPNSLTPNMTVESDIQGYVKLSNGEMYYSAFVFPARVRAEVLSILNERAALKRKYDESMKLIYDLRHRISRGEA